MCDFKLDDRLEMSSFYIKDLVLCELRLNENANYPWLILIPKRPAVCELFDLNKEDQDQLFKEILLVSKVLKETTKAYKLNVATLGNVVSQLHIHCIARFKEDIAWPNPVWNTAFTPYGKQEKQKIITTIKELCVC